MNNVLSSLVLVTLIALTTTVEASDDDIYSTEKRKSDRVEVLYESSGLLIVHDKLAGATCYITGNGIDCIPDDDLKLNHHKTR